MALAQVYRSYDFHHAMIEEVPLNVVQVPKGEDFVSQVPPEIYSRFLSFLEPSDIGALVKVSTRFCSMTRDLTDKLHVESVMSGITFRKMLGQFRNLQHLSIEFPYHMGASEFLVLSHLPLLRSLRMCQLTIMTKPHELFYALWHCTNLVQLDLDFSAPIYSSSGTSDYTIMSTMSNLTQLEHLRIQYAPSSWNKVQKAVFSCLKELRSLGVLYTTAPEDLSFLEPLKHLTNLSLQVSGADQMGLHYELPILPKLEVLLVTDICLSGDSIANLTQLRQLEFTPWGWKRRDLSIFGDMPQLQMLGLRVNWLPNSAFLARFFKHIKCLKLIEFDVSRCNALYELKNLRVLVLDTPIRNGEKVKARNLHYISEALKKMTWIVGLSLHNITHITPDIMNAILGESSSINILELSGCVNCMETFIGMHARSQTCSLQEVTLHYEGYTSKWKMGDDTYTAYATFEGDF